MNENLDKKIFNKLKTKKRANDFILLSDSLSALTHQVGAVNLPDIIGKTLGDNKNSWAMEIVDMLPGTESKKIQEEDIEILESVKKMISDSLQIKIEIPFDPSENFIDSVINKIMPIIKDEEVGHDMNCLIDVAVKEGNEPGALLFIEGRYLDLTFKNQVLNYLISEDVINRYL